MLYEVITNISIRLLPLPDGGVVAATRNSLTAVSATGNLLWTEPLESRPLDWQLTDDALYLTTDGNDGRLWRIQSEQAELV